MATPSARNFGPPPMTRRVGGGNGFSDAFYDQNPDYMGAGDWRYTDRNPGDDGFRIDARAGASMPGTGPGTGKTSIPMGRGFGGLNYQRALQNRNLSAFQQPNQGASWGEGNSAQEAGANLTQTGNLLGPNGRYVPDTMYNRTLGSMNPYGGGGRIDQYGNRLAGPQMDMDSGDGGNQGPNEDQQRWADANAKPQIGAGQTVQEMGKFAQKLPFMGGVGRGMENAGKVFSSVEPQASSGGGNFSRASLIQGAKASGDFNRVMNDYNAQSRAAGTGMQMDQNGSIVPLSKLADDQGTSPFARDKFGAGAEDIRARRDFASGRTLDTSGTTGMVKQDGGARPTQAMDFNRSISSTYGTGSNQSTMPRTGGGIMPDPLTGKMVPMNPYLKQQEAVQNTKFGPDAQQAGEDYLNPQKVASQFSNTKPLDAAKGAYFRNKVRGVA